MVTRAGLALALLVSASPLSAQAYDQLSPQVRGLVEVFGVQRPDRERDPRRRDGSARAVRDVRPGAGRTGGGRRPRPAPRVRDVRRIDGAGHTLIPGLVMLHEHMFYPSGARRYNTNEVSFPYLYLGGGVTTMRTGGSLDPYSDLSTKRLIEEGRDRGDRRWM